MKTRINNPVNLFGVLLALSAALFWGCSCKTSKPTPEPLAGWSFCFNEDPSKLDGAIQADYQDYIQKLSPEEKKYTRYTHDFEDGTGQHAVTIEVDLKPNSWNHILIYGKDNKRIKVIKYIDHQFRS